MHLALNDSSGAGSTVDGTKVLTKGVWHHIAFVKEGNKVSLYADGVLDATKTFTSDMNVTATNTRYMLLGANSNSEDSSSLLH
ncbi:hypothetical protein JDS79_44045, partial [Bacillus cereus]|nr:hypothetical protein [Bacillus cereus]